MAFFSAFNTDEAKMKSSEPQNFSLIYGIMLWAEIIRLLQTKIIIYNTVLVRVMFGRIMQFMQKYVVADILILLI